MDYDVDEHATLRADEKDLFAAAVELGAEIEEYEPEYDTLVKQFKRGDEWRDAINAIRKILKKYYNHPTQPARVWIAESRVVQSKIVPLLERYPHDKDMYYNVGKILVFLTVQPHVTWKSTGANDALQQQYVRDITAAIAKSSIIIPSYLALLEPALDSSVAQKNEHDMNSVDLVLTLFKQLLETQNGNSDEVAGVLELLVHKFYEEKVIETIVALSKLLERRDFKRLAVVVLDFFFQLSRGQESDALFKAHCRGLTSSSRTGSEQSKKAGGEGGKGGGVGVDALRNALQAERKAKDAADKIRTRHSRFGTSLTVEFMGDRRMVSSVAGLLSSGADKVSSLAAQRSHPNRKASTGRGKADDTPPLRITLDNGIGSCAVDVSGHSTAAPASEAMVSGARYVCAHGLLQLLHPDTITDAEDTKATADTSSGFACLTAVVKNKIARDADDITPEDVLRYFHLTGIALGVHRLVETARIEAATAGTKRAVPKPETEGVSHSALEPVLQGSRAVPGIETETLLTLLDRWSFSRIVQSADGFIMRKQWEALEVVVAHMKELFVFIHCLMQHGKDAKISVDNEVSYIDTSDSFQLGLTLVDQLFRDEDMIDLLPRLFRSWEPGRFSNKHLASMLEAAHYSLKLAAYAQNPDPDDDDERGKKSAKSSHKSTALSDKFAGQLAHPSVIIACVSLLRNYRRNSPRLSYYAAGLLRRLSNLQNDYAGIDPRTGKPLTYEVMLYHVSVIEVASQLLNDKTIAGRREFAEVREWARSFSAHFLRDAAENPLLYVEALFWRAEKTANADLARRYGLLDGNVASLNADGVYEAAVGDKTASGHPKKLSKAAQEKNEAEAEARRNAAAAAEEEGEAMFDDADEAAGFTTRPARRKRVRKGQIKRPRLLDSSSDSSSTSSSSNSSGSSSSSSDSGSESDRSASRRNSSAAPLGTTAGRIPADSAIVDAPELVDPDSTQLEESLVTSQADFENGASSKLSGRRLVRKGSANSSDDEGASPVQAPVVSRRVRAVASDSDE